MHYKHPVSFHIYILFRFIGQLSCFFFRFCFFFFCAYVGLTVLKGAPEPKVASAGPAAVPVVAPVPIIREDATLDDQIVDEPIDTDDDIDDAIAYIENMNQNKNIIENELKNNIENSIENNMKNNIENDSENDTQNEDDRKIGGNMSEVEEDGNDNMSISMKSKSRSPARQSSFDPSLPSYLQIVNEWTTADVGEWLRKELQIYDKDIIEKVVKAFQSAGVIGSLLHCLDESAMIEMGVDMWGVRQLILQRIKQL